MSKLKFEQLMADVKENFKKLDECEKPHDFQPSMWIGHDQNKFATRYTCSKCGGEIDGIQRKWYVEGLCDGRRPEKGG